MKRVLDLMVVIPVAIVLAPVILVIAVLVRFTLGSPVLFVQERIGFRGRVFRIRKFRTMLPAQTGMLLGDHDAERLTPFGKALRKWSLDELPQIWNVLTGDMSLVGPRPLLPEYLPLYDARQRRRHEMLPGITGWAQVNGRNALTWEQKFELDVWYIENHSTLLDLKILALTALKVVRRDGISSSGVVTMPRFQGSAKEKSN